MPIDVAREVCIQDPRGDLVGPRESLTETSVRVPCRAPTALKVCTLRHPGGQLRARDGRVRVAGIHVARQESQVFLHAGRDEAAGHRLGIRPADRVTACDLDLGVKPPRLQR